MELVNKRKLNLYYNSNKRCKQEHTSQEHTPPQEYWDQLNCNVILEYICHYLTLKEVITIKRVCRYWNRIICSNSQQCFTLHHTLNTSHLPDHLDSLDTQVSSLCNIKSLITTCIKKYHINTFIHLQRLDFKHECCTYKDDEKCVEKLDLSIYTKLTLLCYRTKLITRNFLPHLVHVPILTELQINFEIARNDAFDLCDNNMIRLHHLKKLEIFFEKHESSVDFINTLIQKIKCCNLEKLLLNNSQARYDPDPRNIRSLYANKTIQSMLTQLHTATVVYVEDLEHIHHFKNLRHIIIKFYKNHSDNWNALYHHLLSSLLSLDSITVFQDGCRDVQYYYFDIIIHRILQKLPSTITNVSLVFNKFYNQIVCKNHQYMKVYSKIKYLHIKIAFYTEEGYVGNNIIKFFENLLGTFIFHELEQIVFENITFLTDNDLNIITEYKQLHLPKLREIIITNCSKIIMYDVILNNVNIIHL
jgi:hypothetical protein